MSPCHAPDTAAYRPGRPCPHCAACLHTWYAVAQCRFRDGLAWVKGCPPSDGPCFAVVSRCGQPNHHNATTTVTLWPDRAAAKKARKVIDRAGCGSCCRGAHQIFDLTQEETAHA